MLRQRSDSAGLDIRRQAGFDANTWFRQEIHQCAIFNGFYTMADTLTAQLANSLPDAFRACRFPGMNRNMPACVACTVEVREEQTAREAQLIARQIDSRN